MNEHESPRAGSGLSRSTICLLLALATLAVFLPVARHGFINYDDPDYVTRNAMVLGGVSWRGLGWALTTGAAGNWHPLTWLSHMLDVQLFGLRAGGHHLVNLLFHVANTLLLFLVLDRMTGRMIRSALVAALFALHPLHVESVAWIAERKDVLSAFFFLLTLWAYERYAKAESRKQKAEIGAANASRITDHASRITHQAPLFYTLSLAFFTLGLMSKPMLVTLPFLLLLLDYWPLKRIMKDEGRRMKEESRGTSFILHNSSFIIREKLPFLALALVSSVITFVVQNKGGAVASTELLPVHLRVENTVVAYVRYLLKMLWPTDLAVFYPYPASWAWWQVAGAALVLALVTALVIRFRRNQPALLVGWLWFLGMMVPVIGLVQVGDQSMADRYSYLPMIGAFIGLIWAVPSSWLGRKPALAGAAALLAACAAFTFAQVRVWRTPESLFHRAIRVTQDNYLAYHNLGSALAREGKTSEATQCFEAALAIRPDYPDAHYDLGLIFADQGKWEEARRRYLTALQAKPDFPEAHNNLGNVLSKLGRNEEALLQFATAVQLKPEFPEALNNLANAEAARGNLDEAVRCYRRVVWLRPHHPDTYCNLGLALDQQGKAVEAIENFRQALKCDSRHVPARLNLGVELSKLGRLDEATTEFRTLLAQQPASAEAHFHLANLLAVQARWDDAAREYREVLRLQPKHADAHNNLAQVLSRQGKGAEALEHYAEALRQRPEDTALMNNLAWFYATQPDARLRNGPEAERLATRELEQPGVDRVGALGTLAAAQAEQGHFAKAVETAQQALDAAVASNQPDLARQIEAQLDSYRRQQPWRE